MPLRVDPKRDRKLSRLFRDGSSRCVKRGRAVYLVGEPARHVYLVRSGHVRLTLPKPGNSKSVCVEVAGPQEVFGREALLSGSQRIYSARAGEDTILAEVSGAAALKAVRGGRRTFDAFVHAWDEDLHRARSSALRMATAPTRERLADVLLSLMHRFGERSGEEVRVPHWFTHQELAELAGAHRSTVTTALNDWIYEGILREGRGELVVAKPAALRAQGSDPDILPPGSRPRMSAGGRVQYMTS